MTDWGRQTCSQISQLTTSIRALLSRLAVRLEKEVQPASLRTGRTSLHSSRLTSLLSIAARTLPCKHTQSQLSRTDDYTHYPRRVNECNGMLRKLSPTNRIPISPPSRPC